MKLSQEKIAALLSLDDVSLWREITGAAQKFGYTLPQEVPKEEDIAKIRMALREAEKLSAFDVARMLASFKAQRNKE